MTVTNYPKAAATALSMALQRRGCSFPFFFQMSVVSPDFIAVLTQCWLNQSQERNWQSSALEWLPLTRRFPGRTLLGYTAIDQLQQIWKGA